MNDGITSQGNDFTVGSEPTGIVQQQPSVEYGHELFGAQFTSDDRRMLATASPIRDLSTMTRLPLTAKDEAGLAALTQHLVGRKFQIVDDEVFLSLGGLTGQVCSTIIAGNPAEYADTPEAAVFLTGDLMRNFSFTPKPQGLDVPKMDDRNIQAIASFVMERDPEEYADGPQGALAIAERLVKVFGVVPREF